MMRDRSRDDGFTLVELVVSGLLASVVLVVIGGVLISSFRAESVVRTVTTSTTDTQLAVNVMESVVRRASAVSVSSAPGGSEIAQLRVVEGSTAFCLSWYYHAPTEAIYERRASAAVPPPAEGSGAPSGWSLVIDGVTPHQSATVFSQDGGQGFALHILKSSASSQTTVISTTMSGRVPLQEGNPRCFD